MKAILALSVTALAAVDKFANYPNSAPAHNRELAEFVNSQNAGWTAAVEPYPHFAGRTHGEAKKLMGTRRGGPKLPQRTYANAKVTVPDSFDARTHWSSCPTVSEIRDQSACGSCWAFGAAESMSDRYCTYFGRTNSDYRQIRIAAGELMSCCDSCGNGCDGGFPEAAWQYWVNNGLVNNTCEPYPFPKCAHHTTSPKYGPCPSSIYPTPDCPSQCASGVSVARAQRYFGNNAWSLSGEDDFKTELMTNGPFEVTMNVYQDFETYKGGIYRHISGPLMGGHAVRIVGWGVEGGVPYWIIANSWNETWGENGYFRILRGSNECGIESDGSAGEPKQM